MDETKCKYNVAVAAINELVIPRLHESSPFILGIGSGSTIVPAVEELAKYLNNHREYKVVCLASSFQAKEIILKNNFVLSDLSIHRRAHLTIDGADEVDARNLYLIKGGGGCHLQEKILAYNSDTVVIIADYRKQSSHLGENWKKGVPLEVLPLAAESVIHTLASKFRAKCQIRCSSVGKVGPIITDNGNFIIDAVFNEMSPSGDVAQLNDQLLAIPGILETGFFIGMADIVYIGNQDGSILKLRK